MPLLKALHAAGQNADSDKDFSQFFMSASFQHQQRLIIGVLTIGEKGYHGKPRIPPAAEAGILRLVEFVEIRR